MPFRLSHSALLALYLAIAATVQAQSLDASKYPKEDELAPEREEWTRAIASSIPNIPKRGKDTPSDLGKDVHRCKNDGDWGLSFDDGPGPYTDQILDNMKRKGVKGTFFVVGSRILRNPGPLKRAYEAGHQIAIHTWSHPQLTTLSTGQIISEIVYTAMAVKEITGATPKAIRPPYGDVDDRVRAVAKALGMDIITWNSDPNDFQFSGASPDNKAAIDTIVERIRSQARSKKDGYISLEHDLFAVPSQAGIRAMDVIGEAGYSIKSIAECTGLSSYSEDIWSSLKVPAPQTATSNSTSSVSTASAATSPNATATLTATSTVATATASVTATSTSSSSPSPSPSATSGATLISTGGSTVSGLTVALMALFL